jgi:hypothetical protein
MNVVEAMQAGQPRMHDDDIRPFLGMNPLIE